MRLVVHNDKREEMACKKAPLHEWMREAAMQEALVSLPTFSPIPA